MTFEIGLVFVVLFVTIFLFVTQLLRIDVVAVVIMTALPWLGLITPAEAFSGFGSNAVVAIIAVMIMGYGIDRSGMMSKLTGPVVNFAGTSEKRLLSIILCAVGGVSAFIQNIGVAALFLPGVMKISRGTGIPASRLLMPMGFAAILGGNISMIGSSPLIILNDLLNLGGQAKFHIFSVTPLGLTLLGVGIGYFVIAGRFILPSRVDKKQTVNPQEKLIEAWELPSTIYQCVIPPRSPLVGKTREDINLRTKYNLIILALAENDEVLHAPWRYTRFAKNQELALLGKQSDFVRFVSDYKLNLKRRLTKKFKDLRTRGKAGFAEIIVPLHSPLAGKNLREIALRKNYGVEPVMLLTDPEEDRGDLSDQVLQPGATIIVHGLWNQIKALADNINFVLITPVESGESGLPKPWAALSCFLGAIVLAISGFHISLSLLSGATAMILLRVCTLNEAYRSIDWKTVFLLAGLIPLGIAMDNTGAARYLAYGMIEFLQGTHVVVTLAAFALLATFFSLFMSNVAATVLLVPLAIVVGEISDINPSALALLVAVCASNSFMIPTNQVNSLLLSPGGYTNKDYMKAGSIMTLIFLIFTIGLIWAFYL